MNSRDNLRETLDETEGVVTTFTQLMVRKGATTVPCAVRVTTEANNRCQCPSESSTLKSRPNPMRRPQALHKEKHLVPPGPDVFKAQAVNAR